MRSYYWHYAKPYTLVQGSQQEITANLNTNIESNDEQACSYIYVKKKCSEVINAIKAPKFTQAAPIAAT